MLDYFINCIRQQTAYTMTETFLREHRIVNLDARNYILLWDALGFILERKYMDTPKRSYSLSTK